MIWNIVEFQEKDDLIEFFMMNITGISKARHFKYVQFVVVLIAITP
jgi:hypothetical protein